MTKSQTAEKLLGESLSGKPVAISEQGKIKIFEFADTDFAPYLIRSVGFGNRLACTSSLTPPHYIFRGPNIGQPMLESRNVWGRHNTSANLSIILKQPGACVASLLKQEGNEGVVRRLQRRPTSIEKLFRTVALVGVFEKTFDLSDRDKPSEERCLDLNWDNILLAEDGSLSLIDQMTHYDIAHRPHEKLDFTKARNSVLYLRNAFRELLGEGAPELLDAVEKASGTVLTELRHANYRLSHPKEQLAYLQTQLSPKSAELWRGVEPVVCNGDRITKLPNFTKVTRVSCSPLDIKTASTRDLLAALNEIRSKSVAH